jgi:hypothetical protein
MCAFYGGKVTFELPPVDIKIQPKISLNIKRFITLLTVPPGSLISNQTRRKFSRRHQSAMRLECKMKMKNQLYWMKKNMTVYENNIFLL